MDKNALIVLLLTVGILLIVNYVMFSIVRGITRGDNRWIRSITETLSKPMERSNKPYDDLREQMKELSKGDTKEE
jgi:hypothetical protein